MKKSEILESILALINEEIESALTEDEALRMSDERREKFKNTVFSNPPADNSAGSLMEAPAPPPPEAPTEPTDAPAPAGGEPSDGMAGAEMPPVDGSDPMAAGDTGAAGDGGGGEMPPMDGAEDPAMDAGGDMGGGGGMGGFGGGGGGGGMDDIMGGGGEGGEGEGGETADNPPPASYNPFENSQTLEDRLQVILDTAEAIAQETQDPQKVLKSVKGLIQNGFSDPTQAAKAISDLFDTNNPVLQQVSRRLAMFTWGV